MGTINLISLTEQYVQDQLLQPATIRSYRIVARTTTRVIGDLPLQDIQEKHLLAYRNKVLEKAKPVTWNSYLNHLRVIFSYALRKKYIKEDPCLYVSRAAIGEKSKKAVPIALLQRSIHLLSSDDECLQPGWFWASVLRTLFYTGMRRRQLISLRWHHVHLDSREILLVAAGSKTKREWRIPINQALADDLRLIKLKTEQCLRTQNLAERQVFNVTLFYSRYFGPEMTESHVSGFFRRLSQKMGDFLSPHRLRHTLATELMRKKNPNLKAVQYMLGHSDIRITLSYIEQDLDIVREVVAQLPCL